MNDDNMIEQAPSSQIGQRGSGDLTLYHGTGRFYEGVPTVGDRDVLQSGALSMSHDPQVAQFFAGGGRDARMYSVSVPQGRVLDLRQKGAEWQKKGQLRLLTKAIQAAAKSGDYDAVAIPDLTFGEDYEFRLVGDLSPDQWSEGPSVEHVDNYATRDATMKRFLSGERTTKRERDAARRMLREDIESDTEMLAVMEEMEPERGKDPSERAMGDRLARDQDLMQALQRGVVDAEVADTMPQGSLVAPGMVGASDMMTWGPLVVPDRRPTVSDRSSRPPSRLGNIRRGRRPSAGRIASARKGR